MKPAGAPVLTYTGAPKWRQDVHEAVIDIDVGKRDLQQCADAIMRLRAEWLYASGRAREIGFNYTDGKRRAYKGSGSNDYASFRKYMDLVFSYAGTYSLDHELKPASVEDIKVGDVFIKGGFPGHAVLVADLAVECQWREALPARAELHAGAGDARPQEPERHGRLALVRHGFRRAPRHTGMAIRPQSTEALAVTPIRNLKIPYSRSRNCFSFPVLTFSANSMRNAAR